MPFQLKTLNESGGTDKLMASLGAILAANTLLSLATVSPDAEPYVNTAYYSYSLNPLCLYIFTSPRTLHARNMDLRPSVSVNIFDSHQPFASDLRGLQLSGTCSELALEQSADAFALFSARFPKLLTRAASVETLFVLLDRRFYKIKVAGGKLLDEPVFGKQILVQFEM